MCGKRISASQIYDLETAYLGAEYSQMGTVLKVSTDCSPESCLYGSDNNKNGGTAQGLEGFLSSKDALKRRTRQFRLEDRLFSLSSKTSLAVRTISISENPSLLSCGKLQRTTYTAQTKELEQQEAELAESLSAPHIGRGKGKGPYATKVRIAGVNSRLASVIHEYHITLPHAGHCSERAALAFSASSGCCTPLIGSLLSSVFCLCLTLLGRVFFTCFCPVGCCCVENQEFMLAGKPL